MRLKIFTTFLIQLTGTSPKRLVEKADSKGGITLSVIAIAINSPVIGASRIPFR